jgi:hypothetical protein
VERAPRRADLRVHLSSSCCCCSRPRELRALLGYCM